LSYTVSKLVRYFETQCSMTYLRSSSRVSVVKQKDFMNVNWVHLQQQ